MASHERGAHGAEPPKPSGSATHASRGWAQRGWLEKKEGVTATWSRHWFQVEGSELHFYDAERAQGGSRLGHIDLEKVTIDHSTAVTADVGEIEIKASTRTHRIQCGTDVEAEEWIEALNAAKDGRVLERPARSSSRPARSASLGRTASSSGRRPGGKAPKHPWTQEEDEKLVSLIIQHGANHWAKIAQQIPGRVGKQCRERWQNHLNPDVNRAAEWSEEEEQALFKWHEILGNKWADIAKHLPGRTDNSVKNYFHKRVGQLKRGAPASRPKKSIEKSFSKPSGPNRALVAELTRQSSSGSLELEPADTPGASPTPPRPSRTASGSGPMELSRSRSEEPPQRLSAPERAQIALRARRNSMPGGSSGASMSSLMDSSSNTESTGENIDVSSPPTRTGSGSTRSRRRSRLPDGGVLKEKNEIECSSPIEEEDPSGKGEVAHEQHNQHHQQPQQHHQQPQQRQQAHTLQPRGHNGSATKTAETTSFSSPIPVSVCTTRVWGAPPPKVFRGPWMSGVNRTSLDALTMEVALPTPPRLDCANHSAAAAAAAAAAASNNGNMSGGSSSGGHFAGANSLVPCSSSSSVSAGGDYDDSDMMDAAINSPGLALLGGAFGVSPNPRFGSGSGMGMGCGGGVESPMVFYSPRLEQSF